MVSGRQRWLALAALVALLLPLLGRRTPEAPVSPLEFAASFLGSLAAGYLTASLIRSRGPRS